MKEMTSPNEEAKYWQQEIEVNNKGTMQFWHSYPLDNVIFSQVLSNNTRGISINQIPNCKFGLIIPNGTVLANPSSKLNFI